MSYTPIAGKSARLQTVIGVTTVNHQFESWQLELSADLIEVPGFEMTADADSNFWIPQLVGLNTGAVNFEGTYNAAVTPSNSFRPGSAFVYASLYCGINSSIGFTLTGKCKSIGASQDVRKQGKFKGVFVVEGVTTYPT